MKKLILIGLAVLLCAAASIVARAQDINPKLKTSPEKLVFFLPDLVVSSISVQPQFDGATPQKVTIKVTNTCEGYAKSVGQNKAGLFDVLIEGYKDGKAIPGWIVNMMVKPLKNGESNTFTINLTGTIPLTDVHLVVTVDKGNKVKEVNDANNWRKLNPDSAPSPDGPNHCKLKN